MTRKKMIKTNNVVSNMPNTSHESKQRDARFKEESDGQSLSDECRSRMQGGLGFHKQKKELPRSDFRGRDDSPDTVIFTHNSSFSLFSSASGSADRCSFASDAHDHESLVSELSKHLVGSDLHARSSGSEQDPNISTVQKNSHPTRNVEQTNGTGRTGRVRKTSKAHEKEQPEGNARTPNPVKSSFSEALKECQDMRQKSEVFPVAKKPEKRRLVSMDLSTPAMAATDSSPRFREMRTAMSSQRTSSFLSPGTPNNWHSNGGIQKGWCSERVPLPTNGGWRNVGVAILPFHNGRTLPSKWEDAERWICSPVSGDALNRSSMPLPHRRPKAKSGPLGPPGITACSAYSPAMPTFEGRSIGNLTANSPFSAGVLAIDDLPDRSHRSGGSGIEGGGSHSLYGEPCKLRSVSIHGWSMDMVNSQDKKPPNVGDVEQVSHAVLRRDMATQMSPEGNTHSSPKNRASSSSSVPYLLPLVEVQSSLSKLEIRDVQVDGQVTLTRWSKKHGPLVSQKGSTNAESMRQESVEARDSGWNVGETAMNISKSKREDAKITAWENLQKAKAEAAVRRLEMKLEKKRASSMDKITKKLKLAQRKAQDMRSSILAGQADQVTRTSNKVTSFHKRSKMGSLSGCFMCHFS